MKKLITRSLILLQLVVVALVLTSCTDVIDATKIGDPASSPRLVVDALIHDTTDVQDIRLTVSQKYFDNSTEKGVTTAVVKVKEVLPTGTEREVVFVHDANRPGHYTYTGMRAVEFARYYLTIEYNGDVYKAETNAPRRIQWIQNKAFYDKPREGRYDTLYFQYRNRFGPSPADSGYAIQYRIQDPIGEGDCYRIIAYRNGKQLMQPANLVAYNDLNGLDGRNFIPPAVERLNPSDPEKPFKQGEVIRLQIQCINSQSYEYWLQVSDQITNGGLFAEPPANVPCNIANQTHPEVKALGWFGAATCVTQEAKIDRSRNVEFP